MSKGPFLRKYGVATTFNFDLFEVDGVDFRVDAVDSGANCTIMKNEGAEATCTNDFVDEGNGYSLALTATEMQAARIKIYVIDVATKVWLDTSFTVETYGDASAEHAFDLDTALVTLAAVTHTGAVIPTVTTLTGHTAQTGDSFARLGAPVGASISVDIADIPTVSEFNARTLLAASYFDPATDTVVNVTNTASAGVTAIAATALADLFDTDSGTTYASAVAGSVVKEIADNAAVSSLTLADIADAVWDELTAGHAIVGSFGEEMTDLTVAVADIPTVAEFEARTLLAADYFDADVDTVANVTNVAAASVSAVQVAALADFFDTNSGTTYASSVAGSVVKEIADNAAGSSLTLDAIADAVWDELTAGHTGAGSFGEELTDLTADIANVPTVAELNARTLLSASYFDPAADTVVNVTNVATLTGHTAQTGDSFARLGAPAGASISVDIADIPTVSEFNARTILSASYFDPAADTVVNVTNVATLTGHTAQTGDSFARLGAPTGVSISADLVALQGDTDNIQTRLPAALVSGRMDSDVAIIQTSAANTIRDAILPTQNVALPNIEFLFVAASDHVTPVTGATGTSVTRSIDGGSFGAGTGTLAEVSNGIYQYDASAADMNGGIITFRFIGTGGTPGAPDDVFLTIVTGAGV